MVQFKADYVPVFNGAELNTVITLGSPARIEEIGVRNMVVRIKNFTLIIDRDLVEPLKGKTMFERCWEEIKEESFLGDYVVIDLKDLEPILKKYIGDHT